MDAAIATVALSTAGIAAGVNVLRLMANRGLVSPSEVEEYAESLFSHFRVPEGDPGWELVREIGERMEIQFSGSFASIRQVAAERWGGPRGD